MKLSVLFILILNFSGCLSVLTNHTNESAKQTVAKKPRLENYINKDELTTYFVKEAEKNIDSGYYYEAYKILNSINTYSSDTVATELLNKFLPDGQYYTEIEAKLQDNNLFRFKNWNGKWGYINKDGEVVIEPQFDSAEDFNEGYALVSIQNKLHFINMSGEIVLSERKDDDPRYQFYGSVHDGLILAQINDYEKGWEGKGFIDIKGEIIIPPKLGITYNESFSEGLVQIAQNGVGFIDTTGNIVIKPKYDTAKNFKNGYAFVQYEYSGNWGFIDKTGKEYRPIFNQALYFSDFNNGLAVGFVDEVDNFAIIDTAGKVKFTILESINSVADFELTWRSIHKISPYSEGLTIVTADRINGNSAPQMVYVFIIDTNGNVITQYRPKPPKGNQIYEYQCVYDYGLFNNGAVLIDFSKDGLGLFNCYGEIIEKPISKLPEPGTGIDYISARNGLWPIMDGYDITSYINNEGKIIFQP